MNAASDSPLNETLAPHAGADDGLDFPEWTGMAPRQSHVPTEEWLAYCRSNLALLRSKPGYKTLRQQNGIPFEFVL